MRKKRAVLALIVMSIAAFVWANGEDETDRPDSLTVAGLRGPTSVGMLSLLDAPPNILGTQFEFVVVPTPDVMIARITSGEVDMAAVPINLSAILYNKDVPIKLAAITGDGVISVVSTRDDVSSVADLRGKRIYNISKNQTPDFLLRYVLQENGIDPERDIDIRFDFSHLELAPQLIGNRVDLAVLPEPFITTVRSKNQRIKAVIDLQDEWGHIRGTGRAYPASAFIVKSKIADEYPELLMELLNMYEASIAWVVGNPKLAAPLAEQYIGISAAVMEIAIPQLNLRFAHAEDARKEVNGFLSVLHGFDPKSIGGSVPDDGFYYGTP